MKTVPFTPFTFNLSRAQNGQLGNISTCVNVFVELVFVDYKNEGVSFIGTYHDLRVITLIQNNALLANNLLHAAFKHKIVFYDLYH